MTNRLSQQERLQRGQLAIVDAIYGAVADPSRWSEVVTAFVDLFGGGTSLVYLPAASLNEQHLLATNLDPEQGKQYEAYYGALNPWLSAIRTMHPGVHVNDGPVDSSTIERCEFYADFLRKIDDLRYPYSLCIQSEGDFLEVACVRPRKMGPITSSESDALWILLPHLQRAAQMSRRLGLGETHRNVTASLSRHLGSGLVFADAHRRVVWMDPEAERIVSGGGLAIRNGQLRAPAAQDGQLGEALAMATGQGRILTGRSGSLLTVPRGGERLPLSVAVGPVDERDRPFGMGGPLAMILITDPERGQRPSHEGLRALFDLTPAEAKLVVALCAGETLASYADATGTSLNTVKTHLKRVFDKTGETRQADLIRRVSNDVALRFGAET